MSLEGEAGKLCAKVRQVTSQRKEQRDAYITTMAAKGRELSRAGTPEFDILVQHLLRTADNCHRQGDFLPTLTALEILLQVELNSVQFSQCNNIIRLCLNSASELSVVVAATRAFNMALDRHAPRDFVSKQVQDSLNWISHDIRSEARKVCGLITFRQILEHLPILCIPHISAFFDKAWGCLVEGNPEVRKECYDTFEAVIQLLNTRPKEKRKEQYIVLLKQLLKYIENRHYSDVQVTGAMAVFELVVLNAKPCVEGRYEMLAQAFTVLQKSTSPSVRLCLIKTLPVLAKYDKDCFIQNTLKAVISFAVENIRKEGETTALFAALSATIAIVGVPAINPFIDTIILTIKQALLVQKKTQGPPIWEALGCLATICKLTPSASVEAHVLSCIDTVYSWGLSRNFITDIRDIMRAVSSETEKKLQDNVLDMISVTLCGQPFRQRKGNATILLAAELRAAASQQGQNGMDDTSQEMLALHALIEFRLTNSELMGDFLRDSVVPFIDSQKLPVRLAAINTISQLLIPEGDVSMARSIVIDSVITRLLVTASADPNLSVRLAIVQALTPNFYPFLAETHFLNFFFTALSDESQDIRLESLRLLCSMVHSNRSHILPALRKELIALVHTLSSATSTKVLEEALLMLTRMASIVPDFVADFIGVVSGALRSHLKVVAAGDQLLIPLCNTLKAVAVAGGQAFPATALCDEAISKLCMLLTFLAPDQKAVSARLACLQCLSSLLRFSPHLGSSYRKYSGLYKYISSALVNTEEQTEVRMEALRVMGVIGAVEPHRLQVSNDDDRERHDPVSLGGFSGGELTHSACASVVLGGLGCLFDPQDNRLASTTEALIKACVKTLLTMCEERCVGHEELQDVFPSMVKTLISMKESRVYCTILFECSTLMLYAGTSTLKHDDLFKELITHVWYKQPSIRFAAVNLCTTLALVKKRSASRHNAYFIPLVLDQLLDTPDSNATSQAILDFIICAAPTLQSLANMIVTNLILLLEKPTTSIEYSTQLLGVLRQLAKTITLNEFASTIVRSVCSKISQYYEQSSTSVGTAHDFGPTVRRGMGILVILQHQTKGDFVKFLPAVQRVLKAYHVNHPEYTFMCSQLIRGSHTNLKFSRSFSEELEQDFTALRAEFSKSILAAVEVKGEVWGRGSASKVSMISRPITKLLVINEARVREKALAWTQNKEEFGHWLDELAMVVLRESPLNVFRCLSIAGANSQSLAQRAPLFVRQIFAVAFRTMWQHATGDLRFILQHSFRSVLRERRVTDDVILGILSVAEHMDIAGMSLPLSSMALSFTADQKGVFAKALHWMEATFYATENPSQCIDRLFSLYSKLGHTDSAISLMKSTTRGDSLTPPNLVQLGRYAEALKSIMQQSNTSSNVEESKGVIATGNGSGSWSQPRIPSIPGGHRRSESFDINAEGSKTMQHSHSHAQKSTIDNDPRSFVAPLDYKQMENEMIRMLCLNQLGEMHTVVSEWRALYTRYREYRNREDEDEDSSILSEVAPYAADAAVRLKSWDVLSDSLACMNKETYPTSFFTYNAALAIHKEDWNEASACILDARRKLLDECSSLLHESYTRAYDTIVVAQQLVELEETIDVMRITSSQKRKAAKKVISDVWEDRIASVSPTVQHWKLLLQTRGLLLFDGEDASTRIRFVKLCRQHPNGQSLERFTLEQLLGSRSPILEDLLDKENDPKVVLEYIKYLSSGNELYEGGPFGDERKLLKELILMHGHDASYRPLLAKMHSRRGYLTNKIPESIHCFALATNLDPTWFRGWRSWAEANAKYVMSAGWSRVHVMNALEGYVKSIDVAPSTSTVIQDLLKILSLWSRFCDPRGLTDLRKKLRSIPVPTWMFVIPQLIARLDNGSDQSCELVAEILASVAKEHPQSLIYALIVCTSSHEKRRKQWAEEILDRMRESNPDLVAEGTVVSFELIRISMVIHEQWHDALETAAKAFFSDHDNEEMVRVLKKVHAETDRAPETVSEVEFAQKFGRLLSEAHDWLLSYTNTQCINDLNCAWQLYHAVYKQIDEVIKSQQNLDLHFISPKLFEARDLTLTLPSSKQHKPGTPSVTISKFAPSLRVLQSKQRPKRISIWGSDGSINLFLLKGREDLRLDERVMQLLKLVNTTLSTSPSTSKVAGYQVQRYSVTPLWHSVGLIGWVNECDTLHELVTSHRKEREVTPELEMRLLNQMVLMDQPKAYDVLTAISKIEMMEFLAERTTGHDLRKAMWASSVTSEMWLDRRTTYTHSLATMSVVGYILGLGDRHPNNIMLQRSTGRVVHIDFGDCFEVAMTREKFPERVPFRLTRMMRNAMEVCKEEGMYRSAAEAVMGVLRVNGDSFITMLEAFVQDPLVSWRLIQHPGNAPEDANVETALAMDGVNITTDNTVLHPTNIPRANMEGMRRRSSAADPGTPSGHDSVPLRAVEHEGVTVMKRVERKLRGKEFSVVVSSRSENEGEIMGDAAHPREQVRRLIADATDITNVAQSWLGWYPFW